MTPNEVFEHLNGFLSRFDLLGQLISNSTSVIASPRYKRKVKPRDVYQPLNEDSQQEKKTAEERRREFEVAKKTLGPDAIPVDEDKLQ